MVHEPDFDYSKPTVTVSKTVLWMMLIALILLCLAIWQVSNREPEMIKVDYFPNHSKLEKLNK